MIKKISLLILLLLSNVEIFAQHSHEFDNYKPLKCSGPMPTDFLTLSQEKYRADVRKEKGEHRAVDKSKDNFLLLTNFLIDDLLLSGKVLFGDTVTNYVNRVADKVLVNDPELRSKLRFYCIRSHVANAFATDQGIIFVTTSLVSQIDNEAQLAFILSHEIAHYEKRHTLHSYLEQQRIANGEGEYKYNTYDERIRLASSYSQDLEYEADSLGFVRLTRSVYNCNAAFDVLYIFQFVHLPFEDVEFNPIYLETPLFKFPDHLILDSTSPIDLDDNDEDDQYSTHPNMSKRRARIKRYIESAQCSGNLFFTVGEESFYYVQKLCRFEDVRMQLAAHDYCSALYNAYMLMQTDTNSIYLQECTAKALYGMAKYRNHGLIFGPNSNAIEGKQQRCYHLFDEISAPALTMVALRYIYNLSLIHPTHQTKAMLADLAAEAYSIHAITLETQQNEYKTFQDTQKKTIDTTSDAGSDSLYNEKYDSKFNKLREGKESKIIANLQNKSEDQDSKFYLLAFADILNDINVELFFKNAEAAVIERNKTLSFESAKYDNMSTYEKRKVAQKERNKFRKEGLSLGIDTVVYVDPSYIKADDRSGLKLIDSETEQLEFSTQISRNADYAGLNITLLSPKAFKETDTELYNDLAVINDWVGEWLDHDPVLEMIPSETDRAMELAEKYNTTHFCYTGVFSFRERRDNRGAIILYSVLCYPILPFGLVYAFTPVHHTYFYTLLFDVSTGKQVLGQVTHLRVKSKNGFINSVMYDTMFQIRSHKKEKRQAK